MHALRLPDDGACKTVRNRFIRVPASIALHLEYLSRLLSDIAYGDSSVLLGLSRRLYCTKIAK